MKNTVLLIIFSLVTPSIDEIYVGEAFPWTIYYDSNKKQPTVEIGGIKYGYLDYLHTDIKNDNIIAKSKIGELYTKDNVLYYKNDLLNINVKLKRKSYSLKIDNQRKKIFGINAFNEISHLKDSLNFNDYKFQWGIKTDYEFYRDTNCLPKDYVPNFKKDFYETFSKMK